MHELSVTESILKICKSEAEKHKFNKILNINIKVGELTGLIPECISFYFNEVSKNTVAEGTSINISKVPLRYKCKNCSHESYMKNKEYKCSLCGSSHIKLLNGREFYIDTMEVE